MLTGRAACWWQNQIIHKETRAERFFKSFFGGRGHADLACKHLTRIFTSDVPTYSQQIASARPVCDWRASLLVVILGYARLVQVKMDVGRRRLRYSRWQETKEASVCVAFMTAKEPGVRTR